jgi:putative N-acetylmannosamine-6-phosphate epimerase
MGVNMILLTGNPGVGVTNEAIVQTLALYKKELGDRLVLAAGKMHASGIITEGAENIITRADVKAFAEAGADIILLPAPGTVPGISLEYVRELISYAHSLGCLTITAIGTSQEGADIATIRQIALMCKMAGTDIHHLGDAGYGGMSLPENIQAYSIAIRGIRHTYRRMAGSVNR